MILRKVGSDKPIKCRAVLHHTNFMPDKEPTISDILKDQKSKEGELEALFIKGENRFYAMSFVMACALMDFPGESTLADCAHAFLPKLKEFIASQTREQLEDMIISRSLGTVEEELRQIRLLKEIGNWPPIKIEE